MSPPAQNDTQGADFQIDEDPTGRVIIWTLGAVFLLAVGIGVGLVL